MLNFDIFCLDFLPADKIQFFFGHCHHRHGLRRGIGGRPGEPNFKKKKVEISYSVTKKELDFSS